MGGGEYSAYMYARGLAEQGHEIHVLTSHPRHSVNLVSDSKNLLIHEKKQGIYIHRILGVKTLRWHWFLSGMCARELFFLHSLPTIISFVAREKPDIIHSLNIQSIPLSVVAAKICKVPIVVTYNSFAWTCPKGERLIPGGCEKPKSFLACFSCIKRFGHDYSRRILDHSKTLSTLVFLYEYILCSLFRTFLKMTNKVIAISSNVGNVLIQNSLPSNKVEIISVPVSIQHVGNSITIRRRYGFPEKEPIILFVSTLFRPAKGSDLLLNAIPIVLKTCPNAKFLIVGNVPPVERKIVEGRNLQDHVILLGYINNREEMWDIYRASDIVLCLESRGISRVLLEAMSMGKPVIAPNVEEIRRVVNNKINGILVHSNSARDLAEAINRLSNDNFEFSKRLGESARRTIEERFTDEATIRKIIGVYNEILKNPEPKISNTTG